MGHNYLVTGGAGFIGSNLVDKLHADAHRVRLVDDLSTGREGNLARLADDVEVIRASISDPDVCAKACDGIDYVLHQAAVASVQRSFAAPGASCTANVTGTANLFDAARQAGVKRVVFASSSAVYGDSPALPKEEGMPRDPMSPYAVSKATCEDLASVFRRAYGMEIVALRYFNVFGPRQDPNSQYAAVIPKFIELMLENKAPLIFGDGLQSRDFCPIAHVVDANIRAATVELPQDASCVYNIACGGQVSLLDLVEVLNGLLGTSLKAKHEPERLGDVKHSRAAIEAAERELGYKPWLSFEQALEETVRWYRDDG